MPGRLFVIKAARETYKDLGNGLKIHYPDVEHREAQVGYCFDHNSCMDEDFTEQTVVFTKWSDQELTVRGESGELHTITVIDERDVLAVFAEEGTP